MNNTKVSAEIMLAHMAAQILGGLLSRQQCAAPFASDDRGKYAALAMDYAQLLLVEAKRRVKP